MEPAEAFLSDTTGTEPRLMTASLHILKTRADFLRVAKGQRATRHGLVLQAIRRESQGENEPRFGFTATRKIGNAVIRNRTKRRLRHAVRDVSGQFAEPGWDYVVIGRRSTAHLPYDALVSDLKSALTKVLTKDGRPA